MKCVIPGDGVKVFGRAVHSLSKIGDELYIEPTDTGLSIRTVNTSRSAFGCFLFPLSFFAHYECASQDSDVSEDELPRCKVGMKSCLTVFKSLVSIDKLVDKCAINLDTGQSRLVFKFYCKHGIVKTHNLCFTECDSLQAVYSKDFSPNVITAHARLLADAVSIFQNNQEEISIVLDPMKLTIKNFVDNEKDPSKVIYTQMNLDIHEFEKYQVGVDSTVTFCLKEFRAVLFFAESSNQQVTLHFEKGGSPLVVTLDSNPAYEGHFVLATLAEDDPNDPYEGAGLNRAASTRPSSTQSARRPVKRGQGQPAAQETSVSIQHNESFSRSMIDDDRTRYNATSDERDTRRETNNHSPAPADRTTACPHGNTTHSMFDRGFCDKCNSDSPEIPCQMTSRILNATRTAVNPGDAAVNTARTSVNPARTAVNPGDAAVKTARTSVNLARTAVNPGDAAVNTARTSVNTARTAVNPGDAAVILARTAVNPGDAVIPARTAVNPGDAAVIPVRGVRVSASDSEEEPQEVIPTTPPHKKMRSLFFGISQSSSTSSQLTGTEKTTSAQPQTVLAADTDDED